MGPKVFAHNTIPSASVLIHFCFEITRQHTFLLVLLEALLQPLCKHLFDPLDVLSSHIASLDLGLHLWLCRHLSIIFESVNYLVASKQLGIWPVVHNQMSWGLQNRNLKIPEQCQPKIQNVVGTVNLGCRLDLKEITWKGKATEYNPNRFAAVIMRLRNPKTTGLIFSSGKMVITGARSEEECQLASRKYARIIQKMGFPVKYSEFKVQNVVASADVKFPIHLQKMQTDHMSRKGDSSEIQFMPQLFPGLVYRLKHPKMAFLVFVSGKIVITGAKSFKEINESFEHMYRLVHRFRKQTAS